MSSHSLGDPRRGLKLRYAVNVALLSPKLRERFVQLERDAGTDAFLAAATRGRHGFVRTRLHRLLRRFASDFDVNGWLGMYSLHVASTAQFRALLGPERIERGLDVGAGSGVVTRQLLPLAAEMVATELSPPMARRLRKMGIECHAVDVTESDLSSNSRGTAALSNQASTPRFDLVSCLNVLDRTAQPRRLLRRLLDFLEPGGRLLIALALPYDPFYYVRAETPEPAERLACAGLAWEAAVNALLEREFAPLGLGVLALSRVPYLSFGDAARPAYELDDALFVLQKQ